MKHYTKDELQKKVENVAASFGVDVDEAHDVIKNLHEHLIAKGYARDAREILILVDHVLRVPVEDGREPIYDDIALWLGDQNGAESVEAPAHENVEDATKSIFDVIFEQAPVEPTSTSTTTNLPQKGTGRKAKTTKASKRSEETRQTAPKKASKKRVDSNRAKFDAGVCPHDDTPFTDEPTKAKGTGIYRICPKCGHKWYRNVVARGCKCVTCAKERKQ